MTPNKIKVTTIEGGDFKRLKSEKSNIYTNLFLSKPEDVIICEYQEENFCGRHVLRALSQNLDLFSDEYLMEIARNLAAAEQIYRNQESVHVTEYFYRNTGDYNIQILIAALLNVFNIDLIKIDKLENDNCPIRSLILSHSENIQAFLIQQNYHYYCLRRFRLTKDYLFKIDSKHPMHHRPIHQRNILKFIDALLETGCNVYITIQHIENDLNHGLSTENIATKLWALPDAPADLEPLTIFLENDEIT
ncbi:MAG: hypothetical protein IPG85_07635 [Bacteroidetes bacterium]|nr:hypothetical protein [Bacteroidota bacterium]